MSMFGLKWQRRFFLIALLCLPVLLFGREEEELGDEGKKPGSEKEEPQPIGNFSVPTPSQLAPVLAFGQLLIGEKALLPQFSGSYFRGDNSYFNTISPSVIYGIRDDLSIFFDIPFTPRSRSGSSHSSGIEDIFLQLEYAVYNLSRKDYTIQATVVGNVQFPTGSSTKNPRTGNGSFSYLLGATYAFMSYNWYAFASPGVNITTKHHGTKFGNSYLYQWGFARYIDVLSPPGCIFDLLFEFDGTYAEKDKIDGVFDPNSGGNSIFLIPSVWLASKRCFFQFGVGFPLLQNLNGDQDKIRYLVAYSLGVAFQF